MKAKLANPAFSKENHSNPDIRRLDYLTRTFTFSGFGICILAALDPIIFGTFDWLILSAVGLVAFIHAVSLLFVWRHKTRAAQIALLFPLWIFFAFVHIRTLLLFPIAMSGYIIVILIASQLLGGFWALGFFAASLISSAVAVGVQVFSLPGIYDLNLSQYSQWYFELVFFLWIGILLHLVRGSQNEIVQHAYRNETALAKSNQALIRAQTDLQKHARDLEKRVVQLQVSSEIAHEAAKLSDTDQLLKQAAHLVSERFGFYYTAIFLMDESKDYAVLKAATGQTGQELIRKGHKLRVGAEGMVGYVTATGNSRVADDVQLDDTHYKNPLLPDTRSELALPLIAGQQVIGALDVQSKLIDAFDSEDVAILQTLANQLAIAIDNSRLFDAARRQLDELIVLHNVANVAAEAPTENQLIERTTSLLAETLFSNNFGVLLVEEKKQHLIYHPSYYETQPLERDPIPFGVGIIGKTAEQGLTWNVSNVRNETAYRQADPTTRSELCVPIKIAEQVIGVINTESQSIDGFDDDDVRLLETVAGQLATAMQKIRSYEAQRQRVSELAALREASLQLNNSLDLNQVLKAILQNALVLMNGVEAAVYLYDGEKIQFAMSMSKTQAGQEETSLDLSSLIARTSEKQDIFIIPNAHLDPYFKDTQANGSFVGLPLIHSGYVWGVMTIAFPGEPHEFDDNEQRVMCLLADQAVVALVNARLYGEAQERADVLTKALAQREELVRMRSEFIQNVSHELRTPLAIARGYVELLETGELGELNNQQMDAVSILSRRVQMLIRLVDDLVTILEAESLDEQREEVNLTDLAARALADFIPTAQHNKITLEGDITRENLIVKGTISHLNRVYDNLLGNAIKFTPPGGRIKMRLCRQQNQGPTAILEVIDQGIGIPADKLEKVFERFYQVDGSTKRRYGGTGLGLALVKEIVESHGGKVYAQSELGKGTTFTVILPLMKESIL